MIRKETSLSCKVHSPLQTQSVQVFHCFKTLEDGKYAVLCFCRLNFFLNLNIFFSVDQSYLLFIFLFYHMNNLCYRVFPLRKRLDSTKLCVLKSVLSVLSCIVERFVKIEHMHKVHNMVCGLAAGDCMQLNKN